MRALFASCLALACATGSAPSGAPSRAGAEPSVDRAPAEPLQLAPGELVELSPGARGTFGARLSAPAGAGLILIVASTELAEPEATFDYRIALGGEVSPSPSQRVTGCALERGDWPGAALESEAVPRGPAPAPGSTRTLHIPTPNGVSSVVARVVLVGEHSVIWVDTTHPTTLDAEFAGQFLHDFERIILPRARTVFGTEPDIDGDGRIQLVFSRLTRERGVAFFSGCDLKGTLEGCPASNAGEYLYLTPPEAIERPYNTPSAIKEILAHELAHLLHFNRKVLRNQLQEWVDGVFLSEGVGALAQDVVGYQAGNLYVTQAGLKGIDEFSLAAVLDRRRREAHVDGVARGGAYLFSRYLYDRAGGDAVSGIEVENRGGPALWRALLEAPRSVAAALPELAADSRELTIDFYSTLALSGREHGGGVAPVNPCFAFLPVRTDPVTGKQRGANPFARFHGQQMTGPALGSLASPDGKLRAGGVEYFALNDELERGELALELQVEPKAAPRVRIGRWK